MALLYNIAVAAIAYKIVKKGHIALQCISLITKKVPSNLTIKEMVLEYRHRRD
jgi:hypothetical protein